MLLLIAILNLIGGTIIELLIARTAKPASIMIYDSFKLQLPQ